jgi:hypothetical protein
MPGSKEWRRGDSNPKRTKTEALQVQNNCTTKRDCQYLKCGSEKQDNNTSEHFETHLQQEVGANMVRGTVIDTDLERIVTIWPKLPEQVKKAIIEIVQKHTAEKK